MCTLSLINANKMLFDYVIKDISKENIMKFSCVIDICTISVVENMRMDIRLQTNLHKLTSIRWTM